MTLLITGVSGYLGQHVARLAAQQRRWSRIIGSIHQRPVEQAGIDVVQLDLRDEAAVVALLEHLQPRAIIHTAAATPNMGTSLSAELLWQVNVHGSEYIARWCAANTVRLVYLSSDAIFGGRDTPYTEADLPAPINGYGASKAAAEAVVQALHPAAVLVRTSLIYGSNPPDPNTVMALELQAGTRSGVLFTDEVRCPILADDLAAALLELAESSFAGRLNVVGTAALNRHEFGTLLLRWRGAQAPDLPAGPAATMRRPSRVVLDTTLARRVLHTRLRAVSEVVTQEEYHGADA